MVANQPVGRFEAYLISLDLTRGSEIRKARPCPTVPPDEVNRYIRTVIIAPMTSIIRNSPSRVTTTFQGKRGQVVLDHIRTVDKARLIKKFGAISSSAEEKVINVLQEMFAR